MQYECVRQTRLVDETRNVLHNSTIYSDILVRCVSVCSIDATNEPDERLGKMLNHSRLHANCKPRVIVVGGKPTIVMIAARDIAVGDELLFDYGDRAKDSLERCPWLAL